MILSFQQSVGERSEAGWMRPTGNTCLPSQSARCTDDGGGGAASSSAPQRVP